MEIKNSNLIGKKGTIFVIYTFSKSEVDEDIAPKRPAFFPSWDFDN